MLNYESLVKNLITPLVVFDQDITVSITEGEDVTNIEVRVNKQDIGRVIGKNGKIASAIRTLVYAGASKEGKRVKINIDAL